MKQVSRKGAVVLLQPGCGAEQRSHSFGIKHLHFFHSTSVCIVLHIVMWVCVHYSKAAYCTYSLSSTSFLFTSSAKLEELVSCGAVSLLGATGCPAEPSLEPPTGVVLLAQAFSLGGGANTTFRGCPSSLGGGRVTGEEGSSSRPLSTERSLSLRLEALPDWLPGWEDSLPVRERSAGWSSLRQLGCLSLGLRSGILSSSCRCSFSCSLFSLSSSPQ